MHVRYLNLCESYILLVSFPRKSSPWTSVHLALMNFKEIRTKYSQKWLIPDSAKISLKNQRQQENEIKTQNMPQYWSAQRLRKKSTDSFETISLRITRAWKSFKKKITPAEYIPRSKMRFSNRRRPAIAKLFYNHTFVYFNPHYG